MALDSVTAGNTANATDINQYKEALEGTRDFSPLMIAASGTDFYVRMSNTGGGQFFKVQNSSAADALVVNSAGVVTPTTLQITGLSAPSDVTAGRLSYNTTKNVLVYGNASQVVEIADGASTNLAVLGSEQTVNNTATLTTLTDFTYALVTNATYVAEFVLIYLSGTAPDVKFKWDLSSVSGITAAAPSGGGGITTYTAMHDQTQTMAVAGQGTGADNKVVVPVFATIHNSSTAGNLNLQWAQNTANASDTKLLVGSYMKITRNA